MANSELYHYGIKGMKWGIRRYQNADGSYTSAGKARYRVNTGRAKNTSKTPVRLGIKAKKAVVTAATVKALHKDPYKAERDISVKPKKTKKTESNNETNQVKDISKMSNDELRAANIRYALESKYKQNNKGPDVVKNRLEATRSIANDSSNAANQARGLMERSTNKATRNRPMKPMDLSHMTDQELRDRINRGNLERQYTQLYGSPQAASGRERVATVLDYAGTVLAIGGSAASIALAIHSLME